MNAHVSNIAQTCYLELRRLASIRRFLTSTATATLVSAFVLSRIDYCNSLLFGSTHEMTSHLQQIQNYAARVILRLPMSSSITTHLKSLHWLLVKVRSTYKIACLCYCCHSSTAPSYVTDMLHINPSHTRNTRSSSYTMPLLNRLAHSKATLGDFSFSFASSVWNSIPNDVRCGGGGGVDPIPCVSTHRISDPRSGPAQLLPPHVKQRSHPHGVRPQIPDR